MEVKYLEVLVMDNGEILCWGKTLWTLKNLEKYLIDKEKLWKQQK